MPGTLRSISADYIPMSLRALRMRLIKAVSVGWEAS
jgi:hypothetical protein